MSKYKVGDILIHNTRGLGEIMEICLDVMPHVPYAFLPKGNIPRNFTWVSESSLRPIDSKEPKMKFIFDNEEKTNSPVFSDVDDDQLFVDECGRLCQKVNDERYNILTHQDGTLYAANVRDAGEDEKITRIIKNVVGIKY